MPDNTPNLGFFLESCCDNLSIDKKAGRLSDKIMKSAFSNIGALLIVLIVVGLLGSTPARAMTLDSMSAEITDCQDCAKTGNMQSTGAICSSACVVSVMVDKTAIDIAALHNAKKIQFEILISRLHEFNKYPDPHPPKYTS